MSPAAATALPANPSTELALNVDALPEELRRDVLYLVKTVAPVIIDDQSLQAAVLVRAKALEVEKRIASIYEEDKRKKWQAHKDVCAEENAFLNAVKEVDQRIASAIQTYNDKAELERRAEELRLSLQRKAEEDARVLAEAAALERTEPELAAAVVEQQLAAPAPVVVLPSLRSRVSGLKFRTEWRWRYSNGPKDVATTPAEVITKSMTLVPREFLTLDTKRVQKYVDAMQDKGKIPGIEIYSEQVPVR